jgi:hypothetical protein
MAATIAAVEDDEERLGAAATSSPASTLSSLRVHPDRFVSSAGHTTRLKFALCQLGQSSCVSLEVHTWGMMHL